ncbi:MAG: 50S ribosomal protein L13 [Candidatus Ratteibacteria bacterium]|nr:50S ribosomal protein L13 [Candidatus Ratteibacteria bacterium]
MKTTYFPKKSEVKRNWYLIDADNFVLGRLASKTARILRGKNKASFTPYLDTGDFVVVINAEKIRVTGNKEEQKKYWRHSGYPGGIKSQNLAVLRERHPERIIQKAVRGMLPHTKLGRQLIKKLKVYRGPTHPHQAQVPGLINL